MEKPPQKQDSTPQQPPHDRNLRLRSASTPAVSRGDFIEGVFRSLATDSLEKEARERAKASSRKELSHRERDNSKQSLSSSAGQHSPYAPQAASSSRSLHISHTRVRPSSPTRAADEDEQARRERMVRRFVEDHLHVPLRSPARNSRQLAAELADGFVLASLAAALVRDPHLVPSQAPAAAAASEAVAAVRPGRSQPAANAETFVGVCELLGVPADRRLTVPQLLALADGPAHLPPVLACLEALANTVSRSERNRRSTATRQITLEEMLEYRERHRDSLLAELQTYERAFGQLLELRRIYQQELTTEGKAPEDLVRAIMQPFAQLAPCVTRLVAAVQTALQQLQPDTGIAAAYMELLPALCSSYRKYRALLRPAREALTQLKKRKLSKALETCKALPAVGGRSLHKLLRAPGLHLAGQIERLDELTELTRHEHVDYLALRECVAELRKVSSHWRVHDLQDELVGTDVPVVAEPSRRFEHEGPLALVTSAGPRALQAMLFSDLLLFVRRHSKRSAPQQRFEDGAVLERTAICADLNADPRALTFVVETGTKRFTMMADTLARKAEWQTHLRTVIADLKVEGFSALLRRLQDNDRSLAELRLGGCHLGQDELVALTAALTSSQHCQRVLLPNNLLGPGAASGLADLLARPSLTHVDLSDNQLGERCLLLLAESLRLSGSLTYLSLQNVQASPPGVTALADALQQHPTLTFLGLERNAQVGAEGAVELAHMLKQNSSLTALHLAACGVGDSGARELCEALLGRNQTLTALDLRDNGITEQAAGSLADALRENRNVLALLNLSGNPLGPGVRLLADALQRNTTLVQLGALSRTSPPAGAHFAEALRHNDTLQSLAVYVAGGELDHALQHNFALCEIRSPQPVLHPQLDVNRTALARNPSRGYPAVANELAELVRTQAGVRELNLSHCPLEALPAWLGQLLTLQTLVLFNNQLSALPPPVLLLSRLTRLVLRANRLTSVDGLGQLPQLTELDLSHNLLSSLPSEVSRLSALRTLLLAHNRLSVLPPELYQLRALTSLSVRHNALRPDVDALVPAVNSGGTVLTLAQLGLHMLSSELTRLSALQELTLNQNKFSQLPTHVCALLRLRKLSVANNKLQSLPPQLGRLTNLVRLVLSSNELTALPLEVSQLKQLTELNLERNYLDSLPAAVLALRHLRLLWLDGNRQLSRLPADIGRLEGLERLSFSDCSVATLPRSVGDLLRLERLWCLNNQLVALPPELGALEQLAELVLDGNKLSALPAAVSRLTKLHKLSLKNNSLIELPAALGLLTALTELELGGNVQLRTPPLVVVQRGREAVLPFLADLLEPNSEEQYRLKLVFAAPPAAPHTSTLIRLITQRKALRKLTRSMNEDDGAPEWTEKVTFDREGRTEKRRVSFELLEVVLGPGAAHCWHALPPASRTIFVLTCGAEDEPKDVRPFLESWLQIQRVRAPDATALLVVTYASEEPSARVLEPLRALQAQYGLAGLLCVARSGRNIDLLVGQLKQLASSFVHMGERWPRSYLTMERLIKDTKVIKRRGPPVMLVREFRKLTKEVMGQVPKAPQLERGLRFLHDAGAVVMAPRPRAKAIIGRRQWLIRLIDDLLSPPPGAAGAFRDGLLQHSAMSQLWPEAEYPARLHGLLLDALQSFGLLLPLGPPREDRTEGQSLIPALLSAARPSNLRVEWDPHVNEPQQELTMELSHVPAAFFDRLLMQLFGAAEPRSYWRSGLLLAHPAGRALVEFNWTDQWSQLRVVARGPKPREVLAILVAGFTALKNEFGVSAHSRSCILCPHCLAQGLSFTEAHRFGEAECRAALSLGQTHLRCMKGTRSAVRLDLLVPGSALPTLRVVPWADLGARESLGGSGGAEGELQRAQYRERQVVLRPLSEAAVARVAEVLREPEATLAWAALHPNVLSVLGICSEPSLLVLEFMAIGTLQAHLRNPFNKPINGVDQFATRVAIDVARGLTFLHQATPPHVVRDLSSSRVLLGRSNDDPSRVTAKIVLGPPPLLDPRCEQPAGARVWLAPELLSGRPAAPSADIHSMGVLLWELTSFTQPYLEFTDVSPYPDELEDAIVQGIRPGVPSSVPIDFSRLILTCWARDPALRPKAADVEQRLRAFEVRNSWSQSSALFPAESSNTSISDNTPTHTGAGHDANSSPNATSDDATATANTQSSKQREARGTPGDQLDDFSLSHDREPNDLVRTISDLSEISTESSPR